MKKIFLFLNIFFALGVIINSCISEKVEEIIEEPDPEDPNDPVDPVDPEIETQKTFYFRFIPDATSDSTSVTTYAGPSLLGSLPSLIWSNTESAGVFLTGSNNALLLSNKQCNFTYESVFYTETLTTAIKTASVYGYTPFQASASGTTVSYTLSNMQNQSADLSSEFLMDDVLDKNVFTISPASTSFNLDGGTAPMTFKSVFAFLRFQVKKSTAIFDIQRVTNIKLYIADTTDIETPVNSYPLAGNYSIDVSKAPGTSGYSGPIFSQSSRYNVITSVVTGGNFISDSPNSPYLWFVINPIKIKSSERLISVVETTSGYKIISKHNIPELVPNNIYTMTIDANKDNTVSNQIMEISGGKISNCHIASSTGIYRMYLKKISGESLSGESVSWLWASKEGANTSSDISELIDPASINYNKASGHVDFRVGTTLGKLTKGNVILALKNQANEIVWTWHIWITDKPEEYAYENGKLFLDRNLGALSAEMVSPGIDNYGFVYQWGRKDPFFGGNGSANETTAMSIATSKTIRNGSEWTVNSNESLRTTDMAKKNPMTFIVNSISANDEYADWLSVSDQTCWLAIAKTDNDPCPYGYKVPSRSDLASLYVANPTSAWYFNYASTRYWEFKYLVNKVTAWPAAGMRIGRGIPGGNSGGQLIYSGTSSVMGQCFYWTSTPFVLGASHRVYTVGNKLYSEDDHGDNADAYPVRCVKMPNP